MPNWCDNILTIKGPKAGEAMLSLRGKTKHDTNETLLDFDQLIPYPARFAELDDAAYKWEREQQAKGLSAWGPDRPKDGYNKGGYEWCVEHWGTKWGACETRYLGDVHPNDTEATMQFSTAWAPPIPIIGAIARKFPELEVTIDYAECGAAYAGVLTVVGETVVAHVEDDDYRGDRGG